MFAKIKNSSSNDNGVGKRTVVYDLGPFGVFSTAVSVDGSFGKIFSFSDSEAAPVTPFALNPPLNAPLAVGADDFERGYGTYGDGVMYWFQLWMENGSTLSPVEESEVTCEDAEVFLWSSIRTRRQSSSKRKHK